MQYPAVPHSTTGAPHRTPCSITQCTTVLSAVPRSTLHPYGHHHALVLPVQHTHTQRATSTAQLHSRLCPTTPTNPPLALVQFDARKYLAHVPCYKPTWDSPSLRLLHPPPVQPLAQTYLILLGTTPLLQHPLVSTSRYTPGLDRICDPDLALHLHRVSSSRRASTRNSLGSRSCDCDAVG